MAFNTLPSRFSHLEKAARNYIAKQKALKQNPQDNEQSQNPINPQTNLDKDNFIYVPEINLYVSKKRTHLNKDWYKTHSLLHEENLRMPTIPEFIEFLKYTRENEEELFKDITEVRDPWRGNWLDAKFSEKDGKMFIAYNHYIDNEGNLQARNTEILDNYLTEDRAPGIDLSDWLDNHNQFGLPTQNSKQGDLLYWSPVDGRVARFGALSDCAYLGCNGYPSCGDSSLGVFACAEGAALENQTQGGNN